MNNQSFFQQWKKYRLPRPVTRRIAEECAINFDTLYKMLNGTNPITALIVSPLCEYTDYKLAPSDFNTHNLDDINRFLLNEVYMRKLTEDKLLNDLGISAE